MAKIDYPIQPEDCPEGVFSRPLNIQIASEACLDTNKYPNGVANSVAKVALFLCSEGHRVNILAPKPSPDTVGGANIRTVSTFVFDKFPVGNPSKELVRKELRGFKPDILYAAAPFGALGNLALKTASKSGVPSIANYQTDVPQYAVDRGFDELFKMFGLAGLVGLPSEIAAARLKKIHDHASLNLAPSNEASKRLVRYGVDERAIGLWGRGVDTELFHPSRQTTDTVERLRRELSPGGRPIVGYVGRLAPEKFLDDLMVLQDLNAEIVLVGDGTSRPELERLYGDRIQFRGSRNGEDLANHYAALDVFVHTGQRETFGQTLQEAMATGLPVVAPAIGGPLDLIKQGKNGFLYQTNDGLAELHQYVSYLIDHPVEAARVGANGRDQVEDRSWSRLGHELLRYFALVREQRYHQHSW